MSNNEVVWNIDLKKVEKIDKVLEMIRNKEEQELEELLNSLKLTKKVWKSKSGDIYHLIKYDKNGMTYDMATTTGLLRSIVVNDEGKIVCYSPGKSIHPKEEDMKTRFTRENIEIEEIVEGTMINVFYDKGNWEIATKSSVGGEVLFYSNGTLPREEVEKKTFRRMFLEVMLEVGLDFDNLNKDYCYSFVMQHPSNRIVCPIKEMRLYVIGIYKIENLEVREMVRGVVDWSKTKVKEPLRYEGSIEELKEKYASMNAEYEVVGLSCREKLTGERYKYINPNYEIVKNLKGNQPKMQYQYLSLRKQGNVKDFLKYYPEMKKEFILYRDQVHKYTMMLYDNYKSCFVKKLRPLNEFPKEYKTYMYKLHYEIYLPVLREKGDHITINKVIDFVNNLHPAQLMYVLNYNMREYAKSEKK